MRNSTFTVQSFATMCLSQYTLFAYTESVIIDKVSFALARSANIMTTINYIRAVTMMIEGTKNGINKKSYNLLMTSTYSGKLTNRDLYFECLLARNDIAHSGVGTTELLGFKYAQDLREILKVLPEICVKNKVTYVELDSDNIGDTLRSIRDNIKVEAFPIPANFRNDKENSVIVEYLVNKGELENVKGKTPAAKVRQFLLDYSKRDKVDIAADRVSVIQEDLFVSYIKKVNSGILWEESKGNTDIEKAISLAKELLKL